MNKEEFLIHMNIIRDLLKNPILRIIIFHNPYTETQQHIIDTICIQNIQIIGQVERKKPYDKSFAEIKRLINSHHEPFEEQKHLQLVILGQQKVPQGI